MLSTAAVLVGVARGDRCLATPFKGNDIHKLYLFHSSNVTGVQISSQDCIELHNQLPMVN